MEQNKKSKEKRIIILLSITLVAIVILASVFLLIPNINNVNSNQNTLTNSYINVTAAQASDIINTSSGLTIIDCRGLDITCSSCLKGKFNRGHIEGAILTTKAEDFYNNTNDTLVYSKDGVKAPIFCEELEGHVYGNIYNLQGGYEAWEAQGFPISTETD